MPKNYIFTDYENVQPDKIGTLSHPDFHIRVFVGASQKSILTKKAEAMQPLGRNLDYVRITGNGKNALDFHIAYYLGLHAKETDVTFCIISKDTGFDPLVQHLVNQNIAARRVETFNELFGKVSANMDTLENKVKLVTGNLKSRSANLPATEAALQNSINTLFDPRLKKAELKNIVGRLKKLGLLAVENGKIRYSLK